MGNVVRTFIFNRLSLSLKIFIFGFLTVFISQLSWAQGITYHGRLLNSSGALVTATAVQFLIEIRTPGNENCLMYSETQTKNLSTTGGAFAITLNDGTGTRNDSSGLSFANVFANKGTVTFPGGTCAIGTTRAFSITDGRRVRVYFNDGTFGGWEAFPDESMNFAPMAVESAQVSGYKASNLLRSDVGTTVPEFTSTDITELISLVSGASNLYSKQSSAAGNALPSYAGNPTTPVAGSMWYDSSTGTVKFHNGTSAQTLSTGGSLGAGSAGSPSLTFSADADTGLYNSGANGIGFSAGGAQIFNMSTTTFASPATGGALITSANGTAAAPAFSFTGDPDTGWYRAAANTLAASTDGTERMRFDATGNVGIGVSSPKTPLEIQTNTNSGGGNMMGVVIRPPNNDPDTSVEHSPGGAYSSNLSVISQGGDTYGGIHSAMNFPGGAATNTSMFGFIGIRQNHTLWKYDGNNTPVASGDYLPGLAFAGLTGTTVGVNTSIGAAINGVVDGAVTPGVMPTAINFRTSTTNLGGLTERMRISSAGNVGIGTTSPGYALTIAKSAANTTVGSLQNTAASGYSAFRLFDEGSVDRGIIGWSNTGAPDNPGGLLLSTRTTDPLLFVTDGVQRMKIDPVGNIGIGNTNPTAKLDVNGSIRTSQVDNTGSAAINWASGNVQYTTDSCGAFTFTNLLDGGSYTFVVQGGTSGVCTFSQAGLTFKFNPANAATTATSHTVYSMIRAGNYVYVSWATGM